MEFLIATAEWMAARGLLATSAMAANRDRTKFILHSEFYRNIAGGGAEMGDAHEYGAMSAELRELLASEEWQGAADGEKRGDTAGYLQAAGALNLMAQTRAGIQSAGLTGAEALRVRELYPDWSAGVDVKVGERYNYGGKLWEVLQAHTTQEDWAPGTATLALFVAVDAMAHAGTLEDPVPYTQGMALELGKYYTQYGVVYECIQASGALVYDLKDVPALARPVE